MEDLPDAGLLADDDDGRLGPGIVTAYSASKTLIRRGGNAR